MKLSAPCAVSLAVFLAACEGDLVQTPPPPPPPPAPYPTFSVVNEQQWAGSLIDIRMRGNAPRPEIVLMQTDQGTQLQLVLVDDSTLRGELRRNAPGGRHGARLYYDMKFFALDTITVFGPTWQSNMFMDTSEGTLHGIPLPGSDQLFLVGTTRPMRIMHLDGRFISFLPAGAHRLTAPGPTPDPSVWLLRSRPGGPLERWQLSDQASQLLDSLPYTGQGAWQTYAELGPDRLLAIQDGDAKLLQRVGNGYVTTRSLILGGFTRVVMSPRGDRAAVTASHGVLDPNLPSLSTGVPVFRVPEGDVAYLLPETKAVSAAAFSPDGSLLAVAAGEDWENTRFLQIHDAATGALIHKIQPGHVPIRGVAFDPYRPILYVFVRMLGGASSEVHELQAWSTITWNKLGGMAGGCREGCEQEVMIVVGQDEVQAVQSISGYQPGVMDVWSFTVPPADHGLKPGLGEGGGWH